MKEFEFRLEEWRKIPSFPSYMASDKGRIRGPFGVRSLSDHRQGYKMVSINTNGVPKSFYAHRLIASAFIANPYSMPQINHIDGDKANNEINNIEWCSAKQNINHSFDNGLSKQGANNKRTIPVRATSLHNGNSFVMYGGKDMISKGFIPSLVSHVCHGKRGQHKGHIFEQVRGTL